MKSTETLIKEGVELKEVELMLSAEELKCYATYCMQHQIKFNDWIRQLADDAMSDKEKGRV